MLAALSRCTDVEPARSMRPTNRRIWPGLRFFRSRRPHRPRSFPSRNPVHVTSKSSAAPYKIDPHHAELATSIVTLQAKNNSTLIRVGPPDTDPAQNAYFDQESLESITAAKNRFVEATITGSDQVDFGKFNGGFVIPKAVWPQLQEVPDLQGVLICLGAFTKAGGLHGQRLIG